MPKTQPKTPTFATGARIVLDRTARHRVRILAETYHRQGRLTHCALILLSTLMGFLGAKSGQCDPCYETLAAASGVSRASVHRALAQLEECKLVAWTRRLLMERVWCEQLGKWRRRARNTSNAYQIIAAASPGKPFAQEEGCMNPGQGFDLPLRRGSLDRPLHPAEVAALKRLGAGAAAVWAGG